MNDMSKKKERNPPRAVKICSSTVLYIYCIFDPCNQPEFTGQQNKKNEIK